MQFPPPKELTFLAYMTRLTSEEYFELIKKWNEEYEEKKKRLLIMTTYNTIFYDVNSDRYFPGNEANVIDTLHKLIFNGEEYGVPLNKAYDAIRLSGNEKYENYRVCDFELWPGTKKANGIPVKIIHFHLRKEAAKND